MKDALFVRLAILGIVGSAACLDANSLIVPNRPTHRNASALDQRPVPPAIRVKPQRDRKDTPYIGLGDSAFAAAVERAGQNVLIGLKLPSASEGVDNAGRVLASLAQVRPGIDLLKGLGVAVRYEFKGTPTIAARLPGDLAASLRRHPWVDYVEPTVTGRYASTTPQFTPWGVTKVQAPSTWSLAIGTGVKVIILDTGLDSASVNVSGADLYSPVQWRCLGTRSSEIYDKTLDQGVRGHGTHVAGIIAGLNNAIDVIGASYGVSLYSANINFDLFNFSTGQYIAVPDLHEAACSIDVARVNGIRVVNISIASDTASTALTDQINAGWNYDNMVFVAAVGNNEGSSIKYPAWLSNVIAVTAVDSLLQHAAFANTSSQGLIDLAAPGVAVVSTDLGATIGIRSGTSFAAPHVSAAAALLMSRYPTWTNSQIRDRLLGTAYTLSPFNTFGYGLVQFYQATSFSVSVVGPSPIYEGDTVEIYAFPYGGQSPFTYQWTINGVPAGTGPTATYTAGSTDFYVYVTVTDYYGHSVTTTRTFTVTSCNPPEIPCT